LFCFWQDKSPLFYDYTTLDGIDDTEHAKQLMVGLMKQPPENELGSGKVSCYHRIVERRDGGSLGLTQERRTTIRWRRGRAAKLFSRLAWGPQLGGAGGCAVRLGGSTPRPVGAHLGGNRKDEIRTAAGKALRAESILNRRSGGIQPVAGPQLAACGGRRCHAGSCVSAPAKRLRACCRRASD